MTSCAVKREHLLVHRGPILESISALCNSCYLLMLVNKVHKKYTEPYLGTFPHEIREHKAFYLT